ncbi:chromosome segregation ATPase [Vibrio variabilis]|uniref:Chromosome segregation ATPase n=1 Tax=Vibrio variabilis TaxID=990271 RepID=A0ABQ0JJA7_9VIBR|nr:chromosome segregation ATPase [Vibrio variabilis]
MKFTRSVLAASIIAVVSLAGCGSDSKTEVPEVVAGQGQFIDAAVEGIYYHSQPSGKFGFTDAEGLYKYDAGDTITFFLGGSNGLRIGSTSARDVVSPFEATGNYQKAVNLARILQSMDDPSNGSITLPDSVTSPGPGMIAALNNVLLHDMESANDLQDELGLTEWVSEEDALEHLNDSLEGLERGSNEILTEWQRGSGNIVRTIYSTLSAQNPYDVKERLYVTADKLLDEELFEATRG